jgi:hypothetical protein
MQAPHQADADAGASRDHRSHHREALSLIRPSRHHRARRFGLDVGLRENPPIDGRSGIDRVRDVDRSVMDAAVVRLAGVYRGQALAPGVS